MLMLAGQVGSNPKTLIWAAPKNKATLNLIFLVIQMNSAVTLTCFLFVSGYLLFKEFCEQTSEEPVPQLKFYEEVTVVHL